VGKLLDLAERVKNEVEKVVDPETGLTFGQMKMITSVEEQKPGIVKVDFVPSSPFCPIAFKLAFEVKKAAEKVKGIKKVLVYCHGHNLEEEINRIINKS
jgi:metal-sulfur cluster biosynthetic enzyme